MAQQNTPVTRGRHQRKNRSSTGNPEQRRRSRQICLDRSASSVGPLRQHARPQNEVNHGRADEDSRAAVRRAFIQKRLPHGGGQLAARTSTYQRPTGRRIRRANPGGSTPGPSSPVLPCRCGLPLLLNVSVAELDAFAAAARARVAEPGASRGAADIGPGHRLERHLYETDPATCSAVIAASACKNLAVVRSNPRHPLLGSCTGYDLACDPMRPGHRPFSHGGSVPVSRG